MLNGPLKGKGFLAPTLSSLQDNKNLHGQSNDYMVILSCGCSLTLCLLTVLITTFHYLEARCRLILIHTQISLTMGLIMIVVILKIAIFQQVPIPIAYYVSNVVVSKQKDSIVAFFLDFQY